MTMICRVSFCSKCYKENRPKIGQPFIVFGTTSNTYKAMIAKRNGLRGFVPAIYEFQRLVGKTVYYSKICCLVGCGAYLSEQDGHTFVYLDDEKWEDLYTTIKNWNALISYKDETFKI